MNVKLLLKIEAYFPRLDGLVANYRERREKSTLVAIYRRVSAGKSPRGFVRSEVLYMAARVAHFDQLERKRVSPTATRAPVRRGRNQKTSSALNHQD